VSTRELQVGQQLESLVIEAVDPARMKTMAAILQDPNPIHYDPSVTQALGLGDRPVNQGPINLTWMIETAVRFAGGPERLVSVKVRFLGNVFAGERFECAGTVSAIDVAAGQATLELTATADGRAVLSGIAVVALGS
jgi:acyl dehydratase